MNREKRERVEDSSGSTRAASSTDWPQLAHRELVGRVVASPVFARSERLSTLLTYVCDMTLKGRDGELNEQRIGHAVFGRSPDYDSSIDGIVRTQASRLRQRLDLYFDQEGAEEPVRIVIPKGGYVPVFTPRTPSEEARPEPPRPSLPSNLTPTSETLRSKTQFLPWILCILLAAALVTMVIRGRIKAAAEPAATTSHPLWSQLFSPQHPTLEVPGDSGLVLSHVFDEKTVPLNEYLAGDYRAPGANTSFRPLSPEMKALRTDFANRRYTSIVDLDAAVTLAQIAQTAHGSVQVRFSRDLRPNDLKSGNVIFIGAFEANPWVELFERTMNFSLHNDYQARVFSVINRAPRNGEPAHWDSIWNDSQRRVYAVVAFVPNISGNGNALLVEGTSMAGTEAAWDFVADDTELLPFLKRIQQPDGKIPHFELVLGTQNMNSSAVHSSLLAWRTMN